MESSVEAQPMPPALIDETPFELLASKKRRMSPTLTLTADGGNNAQFNTNINSNITIESSKAEELPMSPRERKMAAGKHLVKVVDSLVNLENAFVVKPANAADDDDDLSLHTTESEEVYIDLDQIPTIVHDEVTGKQVIQPPKEEESDSLSMHPSDVEDVDLDGTTKISVSSPTGSLASSNADEDDNQGGTADKIVISRGHRVDVLFDVGNSLLKDAEKVATTETAAAVEDTPATTNEAGVGSYPSKPFCLKIILIISFSIYGYLFFMSTQDTMKVSNEEYKGAEQLKISATELPWTNSSSIGEESSLLSIETLLQLVGSADEERPIISLEERMVEDIDHADDPFIVMGENTQETSTSEESLADTFKMIGTMGFFLLLALSKPSSSSPVPKKEDDDTHPHSDESNQKDLGSYDLSKYEDMKVVDLRASLRRRGCKTHVGRKPVLIQRLASVYKAELDTMTVKQLRKILKSKGFPQGGLKSEIIQKLVEDGCM